MQAVRGVRQTWCTQRNDQPAVNARFVFCTAASCNWLPIFTERFAIALNNTGTREASVYLVVR